MITSIKKLVAARPRRPYFALIFLSVLPYCNLLIYEIWRHWFRQSGGESTVGFIFLGLIFGLPILSFVVCAVAINLIRRKAYTNATEKKLLLTSAVASLPVVLFLVIAIVLSLFENLTKEWI